MTISNSWSHQYENIKEENLWRFEIELNTNLNKTSSMKKEVKRNIPTTLKPRVVVGDGACFDIFGKRTKFMVVKFQFNLHVG